MEEIKNVNDADSAFKIIGYINQSNNKSEAIRNILTMMIQTIAFDDNEYIINRKKEFEIRNKYIAEMDDYIKLLAQTNINNDTDYLGIVLYQYYLSIDTYKRMCYLSYIVHKEIITDADIRNEYKALNEKYSFGNMTDSVHLFLLLMADKVCHYKKTLG